MTRKHCQQAAWCDDIFPRQDKVEEKNGLNITFSNRVGLCIVHIIFICWYMLGTSHPQLIQERLKNFETKHETDIQRWQRKDEHRERKSKKKNDSFIFDLFWVVLLLLINSGHQIISMYGVRMLIISEEEK